MTRWSDIARSRIEAVAATIPDTATFKERKAAIDAAYPFEGRSHWPHRAWLKARRAYLRNWNPKTAAEREPLFAHLPRDPATGRPVIR